MKTFTNLRATSLGFEPKGVLLFTLDPPRLRYPADRVEALLDQVQQRLSLDARRPSATFSPASARPDQRTSRRTITSRNLLRNVRVPPSGSGFFETMGVPILYGACDP